MAEQSFMRVDDVAKELGVSKSYAYKIVQKLNTELRSMGYLTIFGVDIDPLAIEVSKFSLLLKALEDSSLEELEAYHQRTHNRILVDKDNIIIILRQYE